MTDIPSVQQVNDSVELKRSRSGQFVLVGSAAAAGLLASSSPVMAQGADNTGITNLSAGVTSISTMTTTAIGVATTVILFSAGAMVLKRLIWA